MFRILSEPTGPVYRDLIDWATAEAAYAMLALQEPSRLSEEGHKVLNELEPFLRHREPASEWPGTQLFGATAMVMRYEACYPVAEILKDAATGLYAWREPDLPSDLAFLTSEYEVLLGTIAHERDGFLNLSQPTLWFLTKRIPALRIVSEGP